MTSRLRRRAGRDEGFSLTELIISMGIFSLLMVITFSLLINISYATKDTVSRTQTLQQARLGLAQIDRQVRSGNVILNPGLENEDVAGEGVGPYFSMRIFTQVNGEEKCAQWRVIDEDSDGFGDLQFRTWSPEYRSWDPEWPENDETTDWTPVAYNLVKMDVAPTSEDDIDEDDPLTWPPFWVDTSDTGDTEAQFVRITLRLKDPQERDKAKPTSVTTVVTGRNTVFGIPLTKCSDAPDPETGL